MMGLHPLFCLSFYLLYFVLPPSEDNGCFSGLLMSPASDLKLFCGVCSAFNCSFNQFVGEKVISLSYSLAILAPSPRILFLFIHLYLMPIQRASGLHFFLSFTEPAALHMGIPSH